MSDNGFDLIIYLVLTLGASVIGFLKSSKEKKAKTTPPVFHYPEEDEENEDVIVVQQPEVAPPHDIFIPVPVPQIDDALTEKIKKEKEASISSFGRTDEERYAMLEKLQQSRRGRAKKRTVLLKEDEETTSNEQQNDKKDIGDFEFDIRKAIISNEILNRKY